jgi:hypothetical protein
LKSHLKCAPALLLLLSGAAYADIFSFSPTPSDLNDLDHYKYYRWGINWTVPNGQTIQSAWLFFDNIDNWQVENDALYINIMNTAPIGVTTYTDNQGGGNSFAQTANTQLFHTYTDLQDDGFPEDLTVNIPSQYLGWMADGNFGFGFDPDCHYFNSGIKLKIKTVPIPSPEAAVLGLIGAASLVGLRRPKAVTA